MEMISTNTSKPGKGDQIDSNPQLTKQKILDQLAELQQQLTEVNNAEAQQAAKSNVLVPGSPSPRKRKANVLNLNNVSLSRKSSTRQPDTKRQSTQAVISGTKTIDEPGADYIRSETKFAKSQILESYENLRKEVKNQALIKDTHRSSDFSSKTRQPVTAKPAAANPSECEDSSRPKSNRRDLRADDLTVNTEIPFGPIEFSPSTHDPTFSKLEPNSRVRLNQRWMNHSDLQDHLSDRHIVLIHELYSIIRKLSDGNFQRATEWDIPLIGDWVLFGVIAEKGNFKTTNPLAHSPHHSAFGSKLSSKDDPKSNKNSATKELAKTTDPQDPSALELEQLQEEDDNDSQKFVRPQKPKNFITFKLVDLSSQAVSESGSGLINMTLFESDKVVSHSIHPNNNQEGHKIYSGGSGGAYEKFWKEQPGTLVAILNPKVLKSRPYQGKQSGCDVLTITLQSAQSLLTIGKAKDLGNCTAKRLDTGKECGNWCDLRSSRISDNEPSRAFSICQYHLQRQVSKVRAGRAEFFAGTSGMKTHTGRTFVPGSHKQKKSEYDSVTQTGLLPAGQPNRKSINGQLTYICGSKKTVTDSITGPRKPQDRWTQSTDVEKLDGLKRRRKQELEEIEISKLLQEEGSGTGAKRSQSYGAKCVEDARRIQRKMDSTKPDGLKLTTDRRNCPVAKNQQVESHKSVDDDEMTGSLSTQRVSSKRPFSAATIRAIGFDPTGWKGSVDDEPDQLTKRPTTYTSLLENKRTPPNIDSLPKRTYQSSHSSSKNIGINCSSANIDGQISSSLKATDRKSTPLRTTAPENEESNDDDDDELIIAPPKAKASMT